MKTSERTYWVSAKQGVDRTGVWEKQFRLSIIYDLFYLQAKGPGKEEKNKPHNLCYQT